MSGKSPVEAGRQRWNRSYVSRRDRTAACEVSRFQDVTRIWHNGDSDLSLAVRNNEDAVLIKKLKKAYTRKLEEFLSKADKMSTYMFQDVFYAVEKTMAKDRSKRRDESLFSTICKEAEEMFAEKTPRHSSSSSSMRRQRMHARIADIVNQQRRVTGSTSVATVEHAILDDRSIDVGNVSHPVKRVKSRTA